MLYFLNHKYNLVHANIEYIKFRMIRILPLSEGGRMELSVVRTRVEAVVEYLCPDEVGAGLLEDAGEAGDVPPGGDDVGHGGPVL